jgi:hypothetical protein
MRLSSWLLLFIIFISFACHKLLEKPKWNTDLKAPLIKTSLGIENIIRDTTKFKKESDNSIKIVNEQLLYDFTVDSIVSIQVAPYKKSVKLSTLKLDSQSVTRRVSLGQLALAMDPNNQYRDSILKNNGKWVIVPPMTNLTAGPIDVDIQQFFDEASIKTGTMKITLTNQLPINVDNLEFELRNKQAPNDQIAHEIFSNLTIGSTQSNTEDLANKSVQGVLQVNVLDMDLAGGYCLVDTSDAIVITMTVTNVTLNSATAIFPAQNVVDDTSDISLTGLKNGIELKQVVIESGLVTASAISTSQDSIFFDYQIPSATLNGQVFEFQAAMPPPSLGYDTAMRTYTKDFNGYALDLSKDRHHNETVNNFVSHLTGHIKYTGKKVHLSLKDSFTVIVQLKYAYPYSASGYLGQDTFSLGTGSVNFDMFNRIQSGTLKFDSANVRLVVENGLGLPGKVVVNGLTASNSKTGQSYSISNLPLVSNINPAININTSGKTTIPLDPLDAKSLLNVLPDKVTYSVQGFSNPNGNDKSYSNFAVKGKSLKPYLEIEVPLSVFARDLVLSDTAEFVSDHFKTSVNSGSFSVLVDNGFPVGGDLKLYFLDQGGTVVDSIVSNAAIQPGVLDAFNKVSATTHSRISFYVDQNRMQKILTSRSVIFKVKFSTPNSNQYVKIYSNYKIDFKLVGDFNYTVD